MKYAVTYGILPALLAVLLCGCGAGRAGGGMTQPAEHYPQIEQTAPDTLRLAEASNDEVRVQYPAEEWVADEDGALLVFYETDTLASDFAVNVNIQKIEPCDTQLTLTDLRELQTEFEENYPYITMETCEMRSLGGKPAIYVESSTEFTEELLDDMIAAADWAELWIEEAGGREAILALPRTQSVDLYTVTDGWLYLYTGSYADESQIADVVSMMTVLDQTVESIG